MRRREQPKSSPWVVDSSCFITLYKGGVWGIFFKLHSDIRTTDLIAAEMSVPSQDELKAQGVRIETLSEQAFSDIEKIINDCTQLSLQDASVVVLAKQIGGILFSDDKPLRECAEQKQLEKHGSLWILSEMHCKGLITNEELCRSLSEMIHHQRRLPEAEVRRMRREHGCDGLPV